MRGKKIDTEFLSNFIQESVELGLESNKDIVNRAKGILASIDDEIRAIEYKKIQRSKILGVIASFEEEAKPSKVEEAKLLPFFKLSHPQICKSICVKLQKMGTTVAEACKDNDYNTTFSIKQLIEYKILQKVGNYLLKGDSFEDYMKFISMGK